MKLKMDQMKKLIEEENDAAAKHLAEKNLIENSGKVLIEEIENTEKVLVEEIKDLSLGNTENPSVENHENKSSDNVVKIIVKEIESLSVKKTENKSPENTENLSAKNIESKSAVNGDQTKLIQESDEKALTDESIDLKSAIDSETNLNGETDKKESSNSSKVDVQNDVKNSAKVEVQNDVKRSAKVDVQNDVKSSEKFDVKNDVKNDDDAISYGAALNYVEVIKKTNLT